MLLHRPRRLLNGAVASDCNESMNRSMYLTGLGERPLVPCGGILKSKSKITFSEGEIFGYRLNC